MIKIKTHLTLSLPALEGELQTTTLQVRYNVLIDNFGILLIKKCCLHFLILIFLLIKKCFLLPSSLIFLLLTTAGAATACVYFSLVIMIVFALINACQLRISCSYKLQDIII